MGILGLASAVVRMTQVEVAAGLAIGGAALAALLFGA